MQSSFSESELDTEPGVRNDLLKKPQHRSTEAKKLPEELLPFPVFSTHTAKCSTASNLLLAVPTEPECFSAFVIFLTVSPCAYMAVPLPFVRTTINLRELTSGICQKFI